MAIMIICQFISKNRNCSWRRITLVLTKHRESNMQKSTNYFLELGKQLSKQKLKDTLIQNSGSFVRIKTSVTASQSVYSGNINII